MAGPDFSSFGKPVDEEESDALDLSAFGKPVDEGPRGSRLPSFDAATAAKMNASVGAVTSPLRSSPAAPAVAAPPPAGLDAVDPVVEEAQRAARAGPEYWTAGKAPPPPRGYMSDPMQEGYLDEPPDYRLPHEKAADLAKDTAKLFTSGVVGLGETVSGINRMARRVPGAGLPALLQQAPVVRDALAPTRRAEEGVDKAITGTREAIRDDLTPTTKASQKKLWWDEQRGTFGTAWSDPMAYYSGAVESIPGTASLMIPGAMAAQNTFRTVLAKELTKGTEERVAREIASKAAASSAGRVGSILEGVQGGEQSQREVEQEILKLPNDILAQSESFRALADRVGADEARKRLARSAADQAFLLVGTVTGIFGGAGDRALARLILNKGGSWPARFAKGAISEGAFEEGPQGFFGKIGENIAVQEPLPNRPLMEGAVNEGLGGAAVGAIIGGGFGVAAGRESTPPLARNAPGSPQSTPPLGGIGAGSPEPTPPFAGTTPPIPPATPPAAPAAGLDAIQTPPAQAPAPPAQAPAMPGQLTDEELGMADPRRPAPPPPPAAATAPAPKGAPATYDFQQSFPEPQLANQRGDSMFADIEDPAALRDAVASVHQEITTGLLRNQLGVRTLDEMLAAGKNTAGTPLTPTQREEIVQRRDSMLEDNAATLAEYGREFGPEARTQYEAFIRQLAGGGRDAKTETTTGGGADGTGAVTESPVGAGGRADAGTAPPAIPSEGTDAGAAGADTGSTAGQAAEGAVGFKEWTAPRGDKAKGIAKGQVLTFPSEKAAANYAKHAKNGVPRGYAPRQTGPKEWTLAKPIRERTPAQKARDAQLKDRATKIDTSRDDLVSAIAKLGGLSKQSLLDAGFDPKDIATYFRAKTTRMPAYRVNGGDSIDGMARQLAALGYRGEGIDEFGDKDDLIELIRRAIGGESVMAADGYEAQAEREADDRAALAQAEAGEQAQQDLDAALDDLGGVLGISGEEARDAGMDDLSGDAQEAALDILDEPEEVQDAIAAAFEGTNAVTIPADKEQTDEEIDALFGLDSKAGRGAVEEGPAEGAGGGGEGGAATREGAQAVGEEAPQSLGGFTVGDSVKFDGSKSGEITSLFTIKGKDRARIRFTDTDGQSYETHRDLSEITKVEAEEDADAEIPFLTVEQAADSFDKQQGLFDEPQEQVRLADAANAYVKQHGWMKPKEAEARIDGWKKHAAKQGNTGIASDNNGKVVLSLFDRTGTWAKPWAEAGYEVWTFDIQNDADEDVTKFGVEYFMDKYSMFEGKDIHAILAACPCTDFANSGAKHFAAKDKDGRTKASIQLVDATLAAIEYFKPSIWALENPVGRIEKLTGLPPWRLSFDPNHLGHPYTKKTLLWGRFNADLPIAPVEPTEGSKMWSKFGGKSLKTKNARAETPEGFAYSFFMANNAHDNPALALTGKYDRIDPKLLVKAMKAGITAEEIGTAIDDAYYDMNDEAAEKELRALIDQGEDYTPPHEREAAERVKKFKAEQAKKPASATPVDDLWQRYDNPESVDGKPAIFTERDLLEGVEELMAAKPSPLSMAVRATAEAYRDALDENDEEAGRGDYEEAERQFIDAVSQLAEQERVKAGTKRAGDTAKAKPAEDDFELSEEASAFEKEGSAFDRFTATMQPTKKANARVALNKEMSFDGRIARRGEEIERRIEAGWTVEKHRLDGRRLTGPDGAFLAESQITKTAMDFAEFLSNEAKSEEKGYTTLWAEGKHPYYTSKQRELREVAEGLAGQLEAFGGVWANRAGGIRIRVNPKDKIKGYMPITDDAIDTWSKWIEEAASLVGKKGEPPKRERITMDSYGPRDEDTRWKQLQAARGDSRVAPVLAHVDAALTALSDFINAQGFYTAQVNSTSPKSVHEAKMLMSGLAGLAMRIVKISDYARRGVRGYTPNDVMQELATPGSRIDYGEIKEFFDKHNITLEKPSAEALRPKLDLEGESEAEIRTREAKEKAQRDDKAKRDNAPPPEDFVLAGSNRPVDQARARGQNELFGGEAPAKEPEVELFPSEGDAKPSAAEMVEIRKRTTREAARSAIMDAIRVYAQRGDRLDGFNLGTSRPDSPFSLEMGIMGAKPGEAVAKYWDFDKDAQVTHKFGKAEFKAMWEEAKGRQDRGSLDFLQDPLTPIGSRWKVKATGEIGTVTSTGSTKRDGKVVDQAQLEMDGTGEFETFDASELELVEEAPKPPPKPKGGKKAGSRATPIRDDAKQGSLWRVKDSPERVGKVVGTGMIPAAGQPVEITLKLEFDGGAQEEFAMRLLEPYKPTADEEAAAKAKADLDAALGDLGDILGDLAGRKKIAPEKERELLPVLTRLFDAAFRLGYHRFKNAAKFVLDKIREKLGTEVADAVTLKHLQGAYIGMSGRYPDADDLMAVAGVTMDDINAATEEAATAAKEDENVPSDSPRAEPDRQNGAPTLSVPQAPLFDEPATADEGAGGPRSGDRAGAKGSGSRGDGVSGSVPAAGGEGSDQPVHGADGLFDLEGGPAGDQLDPRGDGDGAEGVESAPDGAFPAQEAAGRDLEAKRAKQREANSLPVVYGDRENIAATLPLLLPGQQDDVAKAEDRFAVQNGNGIMFTNGTGTGKTYSGMGIAARFARRGKDNILIAAPSQGVLDAWIAAGRDFGLDIQRLEDTRKHGGKGIVATTYANLSQNDTLADRSWDLVITDESHNLMSSADGADTLALNAVRAVTLHPKGIYRRAEMIHRVLHSKLMTAKEKHTEALKAQREGKATADEVGKAQAEYQTLIAHWHEKVEEVRRDMAGKRVTPVVFLSATPFAYAETIDYAEGYLFSFDEWGTAPEPGGGYNTPNHRAAFFIQHFGYRMRNGRLTKPDANVNTSVMERRFNEWLKRSGMLSTRVLDVDADYERRFVMVESEIGNEIDRGMAAINNDRDLYPLSDYIRRNFRSQQRRYLLEAIKGVEAVPQIRAHLALGRKVVVFHNFTQGGSAKFVHPFQFPESNPSNSSKEAWEAAREKFNRLYPELVELPLNSLPSPIDSLTAEFPNAMLYNGKVGGTQRRENMARFNDDRDPEANLIVVQADAGGAGLSLHDTTGKHMRALLNLGLPTRPVLAIQQEGRIYRVGQASNAIFEYFNTGTTWERWAFAQTIASRASTTENLAMGERARALRQAFIEAFEASAVTPPSEKDGVGGKEADRPFSDEISEWEKAKAFYYAQGKKTSRNKAAEGIDYFATPEPLGLKMVEWANIREGDAILEPSAGHGAIARFLPAEDHKVTAIEPSAVLAARLKMNQPDANIEAMRFEDFDIHNKFDAIVMNPPFGIGGKTAMDHLEKAARHIRDGGRIVALIPEGPMADKRFEKFITDSSPTAASRQLYMIRSISLPTVTFERAGTGVKSRVVILEKHETKDGRHGVQHVSDIDLSDAANINELFDRLENLGAPDRVKVAPPAAPNNDAIRQLLNNGRGGVLPNAPSAPAGPATSPGGILKTFEQKHGKTGATMFMAKIRDKVDSAEYARINGIAKHYGGYWSRYKNAAQGIQAGFAFDSAANRAAFVAEVEGSGSRLHQRGQEGVGAKIEEVQAIAKELGLDVEVVPTIHDLPEHLEASVRMHRAERTVDGLFDPKTGKVYAVAENMDTRESVIFTLLHESAHRGLLKVFGDGLKPVLRQIYLTNASVRTKANEMARRFKYDILSATEEVIADMAKDGQARQLKGWEKFVAFVNKWLLGLGVNMTFTDTMVEYLAGAAAEAGKLEEPHLYAGAERARFHEAWHGTPHQLEGNKFREARIGTGEGVQAFSWGLYFAGLREVATHYRKRLTQKQAPLMFGNVDAERFLPWQRLTQEQRDKAESEFRFLNGDIEYALALAKRQVTQLEDRLSTIDKENIPRGWTGIMFDPSDSPEVQLEKSKGAIRKELDDAKALRDLYQTLIDKEIRPRRPINTEPAQGGSQRRQFELVLNTPVKDLTEGEKRAYYDMMGTLHWAPSTQSPMVYLRAHINKVLRVQESNLAYSRRRVDEAKEAGREPMEWETKAIDEALGIIAEATMKRWVLDTYKAKAVPLPAGSLYRVELAPDVDDYLQWEDPLWDQSDKVKRALLENGLAFPDQLDREAWTTEKEREIEARYELEVDVRVTALVEKGEEYGRFDYLYRDTTPEARLDEELGDGETYSAFVGSEEVKWGFKTEAAAQAYAEKRAQEIDDEIWREKRRDAYNSIPQKELDEIRKGVEDEVEEQLGEEITGEGLYRQLVERAQEGTDVLESIGGGTPKIARWEAEGYDSPEMWASKKLLQAGVRGMRYIDGTARNDDTKPKTYNYVIYDENDVTVTARFHRRDQTQTPAFKAWFRDSKVVDENGEPLVVYHGTDQSFSSFKNGGEGIFFAESPETANTYTDPYGGNIIPVYLSLRNPLRISWGEWLNGTTNAGIDLNLDGVRGLKKRGYDGVILSNPDPQDPAMSSVVYVAFRPEQIKSAIGNSGEFDPANPDIRYHQRGQEADPPFYSALIRAVEATTTKSAPPGQWKGIIANLKGVKPEEVKWSGVEPWLASQTAKVTKEQLLNYLRANDVEIVDQVYGEPPKPVVPLIMSEDAAGLTVDDEAFDAIQIRAAQELLTRQLREWAEQQGLEAGSADEMKAELREKARQIRLTAAEAAEARQGRRSENHQKLEKIGEQIAWLSAFESRWDSTEGRDPLARLHVALTMTGFDLGEQDMDTQAPLAIVRMSDGQKFVWLEEEYGRPTSEGYIGGFYMADEEGNPLDANGEGARDVDVPQDGSTRAPADAENAAFAYGAEAQEQAVNPLPQRGLPPGDLRYARSPERPVRFPQSTYRTPGPKPDSMRELVMQIPGFGSLPTPKPITEIPEGWKIMEGKWEVIHDRNRPEGQRFGIMPPGQVHAQFYQNRTYATEAEARAAADAMPVKYTSVGPGGRLDEVSSHWYTKTPELAKQELLRHLNAAQEDDWRAAAAGRAYDSSHWPDARNPVVHIRFEEFAAEDGARTFMLNEDQSDWGQAGRKRGFLEGTKQDRVRRAIQIRKDIFRLRSWGANDEELAAWFKVGEVFKDRFGRYRKVLSFTPREYGPGEPGSRPIVRDWAVSEITTDKDGNPLPGERPRNHHTDPAPELVYQLESELGKLTGSWGSAVEPAPFVTTFDEKGKPQPTTATWAMLGFKRALRWAVENGFERFAWAPGLEHVGRYENSLRAVVDRIRWSADLALAGDKELGRRVIDVWADKRTKDPHGPTWTTKFQGTYVIGANGEEGFKDGPAIGKTLDEVLGKEIAQKILDSGTHGKLEGEGLAIGGKGMMEFYDKILRNEAAKYLRQWGVEIRREKFALGAPRQGQHVQAWTFDITPEMRESVMKGQPKFHRRGQQQPADPVREEALRRAGLSPTKDTLAKRVQRIRALSWADKKWLTRYWADAISQGMFDRFAGIKRATRLIGGLPVEQDPYVAARFSTGVNTAVTALLELGQLEWRDGVVSVKAGTKGLLEVLAPVRDDMDAWMGWMIGQRARRLMGEGKEKNLTEDHINSLIAMGAGKEDTFKAVARDFAQLKRSVLDLAEEAGLLNPDTRPMWDLADWIPFYRVRQGEDVAGPHRKGGLSHQSSGIRALRGGKQAINDPLENIMMNFQHLLDASFKNHAMKQAADAFGGEDSELMVPVGYDWGKEIIPRSEIKRSLIESGVPEDIVEMLPPEAYKGMQQVWAIKAPKDPNVVRVMRGGKASWYRVDDALLLRALTAVNAQAWGGIMKAFRLSKRVLTRSVTATPSFWARNFVRDSAHNWVISKDPFVPGVDSVRGMVKSWTETGGMIDMMAAGASFRGGYSYGNDPEAAAAAIRKSLRKKGWKAASIDEFVASIIDTPAKMWDKWEQIGDAIENANREAVYEAALKSGRSRAEALFIAKDIMDYSMRGDWALIQALSDTVPFFNARLQGLYKLGRAAADTPGKVIARGMVLTALSLMLLAMFGDDERYKELDEWDKDTYWHAWINGQHLRFPKPFELGVVFGTIPERMAGLAYGQDKGDWKKFRERVIWNMREQLNLLALPQLVAPIAEQVANRNFFTGRPIENQGDQGKLPEARSDARTSATFRAVADAFPDAVNALEFGPKRMEAAWRGYLGEIGMAALYLSDIAIAAARGEAPRPASRIDDWPVIGTFVRADPARSTRYRTDLYDMHREVDKAAKALATYRKLDDEKSFRDLESRMGKKMAPASMLNEATERISAMRRRADEVYRDRSLSKEEKRRLLDQITRDQNEEAKRAARAAYPAFKP